MAQHLTCRIIILNYNGRALLEQCLPSIVEAARLSRCGAKVAVLDNCSRDESRDYVLKNFPSVDWVDAPANLILCSYNAYAASIREDVVLFLNNDIKVNPGFVVALVRELEADPKVFFAAPRGVNFYTHQYESGKSRMEFRFGLPWGWTIHRNIESPGPTMQTGFGAFRRTEFLKLGGYDPIFLPGTVEDMDLCFRAHRHGRTGRYCPDSIAYHIGQVSFKKEFGSTGIRRMNRRNLHLFTWKNIRDPRVWLEYVLCLPFRMLADLLRGRWEHIAAFGDAFGRRKMLKERTGEDGLGEPTVQERDIFRTSKSL